MRIAQREKTQFIEAIYNRYKVPLYGVIRKYLGCKDSMDDVFQEVIVRIIKNAELLSTLPQPKLEAYIKSCKASLSINEDTGVATCNSYCYAASGYTVKIQCKLQQYTGSTWSTLKTWSVSGPYYANVNENWTVTGGFTYRVYCLFSIYNSAGALVETGTTTNSYVFPKK